LSSQELPPLELPGPGPPEWGRTACGPAKLAAECEPA